MPEAVIVAAARTAASLLLANGDDDPSSCAGASAGREQATAATSSSGRSEPSLRSPAQSASVPHRLTRLPNGTMVAKSCTRVYPRRTSACCPWSTRTVW